MRERRDATPDSASGRTKETPASEQLWSPRNVGLLFVAAGVVSPAILALSGEWPAGYGGWGATVFGVVGVVLIGYSVAVES
ncbi:hypothetical protein [Halosimplex salinum]|uniref:hypothetical protein n=1 Tax=Halosimplex salinum TaxID=1710538 RepID=UPI000F4829F4|nr:hypothetical protein [Halosimplex salinum]